MNLSKLLHQPNDQSNTQETKKDKNNKKKGKGKKKGLPNKLDEEDNKVVELVLKGINTLVVKSKGDS